VYRYTCINIYARDFMSHIESLIHHSSPLMCRYICINIYARAFSFRCKPCHIHIHLTCLMCTCDVTDSHVWHDTFMRGRALVDLWWLRLLGSSKLQVSFVKETYKRDDILQERPIILGSLLIVATPYTANVLCKMDVCESIRWYSTQMCCMP